MLSDGRFEKQKGDSNLEKEDRIRQKEQWKQLSPSEKWQYFIDYYLWVTIGVTTGIVILIFLIVHFATKTSFVMGVMAVNTDGEHIEATGPDYFTDFLREHGVMSKRDVVNLNYTIWIDPNSDSDVDSTNLSTIQVLFMTRSVDVFFSDEEFLKLMGGTDYLVDLRDITIPAAMARHNNILIPSNGLHILTRAAKPINKRITIATVDICSLLMPSILP